MFNNHKCNFIKSTVTHRTVLQTHFGANSNSACRTSQMANHFACSFSRRAMDVCKVTTALCTKHCAQEVKGTIYRPEFGKTGVSNLHPLPVILTEFLCSFTCVSSVSIGNDCDTNKHIMNWD